MLTLVPEFWLMWDFTLMDGANTIADIDLKWLSEEERWRSMFFVVWLTAILWKGSARD